MLNNGEAPNLFKEVISRYYEYRKTFENSGRADYISNRDPNATKKLQTRKVAKKFIVAWIIFIGMVFTVIFHQQEFFTFISQKPLLLVVAVYLCIVSLIALFIFLFVRKNKYIEIISFGTPSVCVYYSNNDYPSGIRKNNDEFQLNEIQLRMKRMNRKSNSNDTDLYVPYAVFFKTLNQKEKYTLFAYDKADLLAFVLFLESYFKNINIDKFSEEDIEKMYRTREFGLELSYAIK